ncbi:MAG TPA: hypothetical protein VGM78_03695, partial [Ilumatobacteraceae bacterium]
LVDAEANPDPDAAPPALSAAGEELGTQLGTCERTATSGATVDSAAPTVVPGTTAANPADPALVQAALDKIFSTPDSAGLDRDCLAAVFATLSADQLNAVVNATEGSTDPQITALAPYLLSCLNAPATTP